MDFEVLVSNHKWNRNQLDQLHSHDVRDGKQSRVMDSLVKGKALRKLGVCKQKSRNEQKSWLATSPRATRQLLQILTHALIEE
jgi:hypothetical protein